MPAVASPLVACVVAALATYLAYVITRRAARGAVRKGFRAGQVGSASLVALAHGTNDAQKTMGVITLSLISAGVLGHGAGPPWWVVLTAGLAISLGTYAGGWRIIRTMGRGLTDIQTPQGFAAETSATAVILASSHMGFALSTTQVCTGSILGAGLGRKLAQVRWGIAGRIAVSWLLTLPAAAAVGGVAAWVADRGDAGVALVASIAVVAAAAFYALSRRRPVNSGNVNELPAVEAPGAPRGPGGLTPDPPDRRSRTERAERGGGGGRDGRRVGHSRRGLRSQPGDHHRGGRDVLARHRRLGPRRGRDPRRRARDRGGRPRRRGTGKGAAAVAVVCFAACLAVAAYGIDLIIPG